MEEINERDEYLDKEREIIKNLILSTINKDGYEEIYRRYLRQTSDVSNRLIKEFFDERGPVEKDEFYMGQEMYPVNNSSSEDIYEKYDEYIDIFYAKKKLDENYDIDADIEYRQKKNNFVAFYNISKRLLEMTEWYFDKYEDTDHNKEQFVETMLMDGERMFAFRGILTDKEIEIDLNKEDLDILDSRALLMSLSLMRLCHDYTMANIRLIKEMSEGNSDALSGTMLFHALNTAAFLSIAKEYELPLNQFDLDHINDSIVKLMNDYKEDDSIKKTDYFSDAVSESNKLLEIADCLSNAFNKQKTKKFN